MRDVLYGRLLAREKTRPPKNNELNFKLSMDAFVDLWPWYFNLIDNQEGDGEGANPEVKDLQFTYIPSGAEIISIDAFSRSTHKHDFVIGSSDFKRVLQILKFQ